MEQVITKEQAKALKTSLEHLRAALKKRDELIVLNNAAAAKNHLHAARVMQARSREIDAQADAAVANVQQLLVQQGLGGLNGAIPISAVAITVAVAAAIGLAALAAIFYTNYQVQREERLYASENPILAFSRQASTGIWAVLGLAAVGLGGVMYYDYRSKRGPSRPAYGGGGGLFGGGNRRPRQWDYEQQYPFDGRTARDYDMPRRVAAAEARHQRAVPKTLVQGQRPIPQDAKTRLGYGDIDKTDADPFMAAKVASDWENAREPKATVNIHPKYKAAGANKRNAARR